jgi:hypothetical protein
VRADGKPACLAQVEVLWSRDGAAQPAAAAAAGASA